MKCVICMENVKSKSDEYGNTQSSQRCITCKDSWVCGKCFYDWNNTCLDEMSSFNKRMPCVICKKDMDYSYMVEHFKGCGADDGWWQFCLPHFSDKLSDMLFRNMRI